MIHCKAHQLDGTGFCNRFNSPCIKKNCRFFGVETNADRIRAMSDEELANFMAERTVAVQIEALKSNIYCALMQWLKQPAEDSL